MRNAEKIRNSTDEEMAKLLFWFAVQVEDGTTIGDVYRWLTSACEVETNTKEVFYG